MNTLLTLRRLSLAALLASFGLLGGCNTVEGAGKDIQKVGETVEDTAEDAHH